MKVGILCLAALLASGCVTTNTNYRPEAIDISDPPIGQAVTADVGSTMLKQGKYIESEAVYLDAPVKVGALGTYTFSKGYYLKEGGDSKNGFYQPEPGPEGGRVDAGFLTDPFKTMLVENQQDTVCGVSILNASVCRKSVQLKRLRRPSLSADSFQQTLIYSGRIGDKINIAYREFSNNQARPAFNNDVEYDLKASSVIGYKGAEIEILEATNRSIKYRVIRNFNDAAR
jgi:hypothetical protein